jgi:hypothetical protein
MSSHVNTECTKTLKHVKTLQHVKVESRRNTHTHTGAARIGLQTSADTLQLLCSGLIGDLPLRWWRTRKRKGEKDKKKKEADFANTRLKFRSLLLLFEKKTANGEDLRHRSDLFAAVHGSKRLRVYVGASEAGSSSGCVSGCRAT